MATKLNSYTRFDTEEFGPRVNHGIYNSVKSLLASGKTTKNPSPGTAVNAQESEKSSQKGGSKP